MTDNKLPALVLAAMAVIIGMALSPPLSTAMYAITFIGRFAIIVLIVLIGLERARFFGFRSGLGKALLFISLGALAWGIANMAWLYYYAVLNVGIPYPSFLYILYFAMTPLVVYGLYWLLKNITPAFDLKMAAKLAVLPAALFTVYLISFRFGPQGTSLPEQLLAMIFPLGDVVVISFALVILNTIRRSKLFMPVGIICAAFVTQVAADLGFLIANLTGTYHVGNFVDMLYAAVFFILGAGMYYTKDIMGIKMGKGKSRLPGRPGRSRKKKLTS